MRKYFLHLLKKNLLALACLTIFCIIIYVVPLSVTNHYAWNNQYYHYFDLKCENISTALGMLSVFIPISAFAYKMDKRSVDMYYSLPISKTKILVSHFLVGLILLFAPYTFAYLWGFITIAAKTKSLHLIYYLYMYLASIIPAFIVYSVTSFIFTRANTTIDGIISVVGVICILPLAVATFTEIINHFKWHSAISGLSGASFFPFAPLSHVTSALGNAIETNNPQMWFTKSEWQYNKDIGALVSDILWLLLSVAATVGLILSEKYSKAENCRQISNSIFCYKVQIPAYTVMLVSLATSLISFALFCVIAFSMFVLSIIYKRSIKIGWKFAIVLIASIIGGLIIHAIFSILS